MFSYYYYLYLLVFIFIYIYLYLSLYLTSLSNSIYIFISSLDLLREETWCKQTVFVPTTTMRIINHFPTNVGKLIEN